jgi:crotonobetainyl-CoA:carnitine CoA-transferase CaiB-like acyl-CoA transferase
MDSPLNGLKVLDASEGIAGPYCGRCLSDAGASVVKLEPLAGDRARGWWPSWRSSSVPFAALNHGKRSVALDATAPGARDARDALLDWADVLICDDGPVPTGWRPADLDGTANLVQCVMSGLGSDGPWGGRAGSELSAQLYSESTASLGQVGEAPVRTGTDVASMYAGTFASQGIAAALVAGEVPCRVDVSLLGAMLTMRSTLWAARSNPDEWWGFHLDSYVKPPFHGYQAKDGLVFMAFRMAADLPWDAVVREFGIDWWEDDPRSQLFREDSIGPASRFGYLVHDLWERALAPFTVDEVIAKVEAFGGNAFPMLTYRQLLADEQLAAVSAVDPAGGVPRIRSPWRFDREEPAAAETGVPELGADGVEVLTGAGLDGEQVSRLLSSGLLGR